MWADLLQDLATTLRAALPGVEVVTHADAEVPTVDTVRVLRGTTAGRPVYSRPAGEQNVNLEIWTCSEDTAAADQRLQELEEQVTTELENLPRAALIFKVTVTGIEGDGDLFRPSVGSNMSLRVKWRKITTRS